MDRLYFSLILSLFYFLVKFLEMRYINKEVLPVKLLLKDSIIVFITCFLSFYIIEQIEDLPIIGKNNSTIKKTIPVFTDNPEF
tara:strand:+ start:459 stop:707 length:249 start_codon:yes stop_codon:yes gene_type:complete